MAAGGYAEAVVQGLAPYLNLALQNKLGEGRLALGQQQLAQTGAYQQGELGLQGQQLAQQRAYQQGQLGIAGGQLGIAQQNIKANAVKMLTDAAMSDPLGMTGVMDQALRYAQSVGLNQGEIAQATQGAGAAPMQPGVGGAAPAPQGGGMGVLGATSDLSQAIRSGIQGPQLLQYMPIPLRNEINQILSGNAAPPSLSARNPQARQLMMIASAVDPTFDATQYGARYATARSFSAGVDSQNVKAINQTMSHALHLLDNINQLGNYGGIAPGAVNWVKNIYGEHVAGESTQQNFEQTVGALASELRKVFAAQGGGSLTELKSWEENFPLNASPTQQRSYLQNGMYLLKGAISALQDKYQRGMGPNADVTKLLSPQAQQALAIISNMDPRTGVPAGMTQAPGAGGQTMRAVNPQTGQVIISNDGGQTWQPGR